jgi:hypothetical protein
MPLDDYRKILAEVDVLQERINELKTKAGLPITCHVPEPVTLPEVLIRLMRRNGVCDTQTPASKFVRQTFQRAFEPEENL